MSISIRTSQYKDNSKSTFFQDWCVKRNLDETICSVCIKYEHSYKENDDFTEDNIKKETNTYKHYTLFVSDIIGKIKMQSGNYKYLEFDIQCFKNDKRYMRKYKIDCSDDDSFDKFVIIERFLVSFFNLAKTIEDEEDRPAEKYDRLSELEEKNEKMADMMTEIMSKHDDVLSSVSSSSKKKKKGILKKIFKI